MTLTPKELDSHYLLSHSVELRHHGIRLDAFLKEQFHRRSREDLKRVIASGKVAVKRNQSPHLKAGRAKPSSQLLQGDEVLIYIEKKPEPKVRFDYKVL